MDTADLSRSSQSLGYSLLLHSLLFLLLVYGLPGFLHKPMGDDISPVVVDIMVVPSAENSIHPQSFVPIKVNAETPITPDTPISAKADSPVNTPTQPDKPTVGGAQQEQMPSSAPVMNVKTAEEQALEEKRKKEKMQKQSLVFFAGHPTTAPANAPSLPQATPRIGTGLTTYGRSDYSWR